MAQKQELIPKGPSAMLSVSPTLKEALDKYQQDFKAANLPEGKFIKPPPSTAKWYKLGNSCLEEKMHELNTDFVSICRSPKPSGTPVGKVPMQVIKEFEHQARQNLGTLTFQLPSISECNLIMESWRAISRLHPNRLKLRSK